MVELKVVDGLGDLRLERGRLGALRLAQLAEAENAARAAALQKNDLETLLLMERDDSRHSGNTGALALFKELAAWLETGRGAEEGCPASEFEAKKVELQVALAASPEEGADL